MRVLGEILERVYCKQSYHRLVQKTRQVAQSVKSALVKEMFQALTRGERFNKVHLVVGDADFRNNANPSLN